MNKCVKFVILCLYLNMSVLIVSSLIDSSRYEYSLFENFEKTRQLMIEEQQFVKRLNIFRVDIYEIRKIAPLSLKDILIT